MQGIEKLSIFVVRDSFFTAFTEKSKKIHVRQHTTTNHGKSCSILTIAFVDLVMNKQMSRGKSAEYARVLQ